MYVYTHIIYYINIFTYNMYTYVYLVSEGRLGSFVPGAIQISNFPRQLGSVRLGIQSFILIIIFLYFSP